MSAAFHTINSRHLPGIIKKIVDKYKYRLIKFLLSGTVIDTRINATSKSKALTSNVGSSQGAPKTCTFHYLPSEAVIPNEVAYTDNIGFIWQNFADLNEIKEVLKNTSLKSKGTR